MADARLCRMYTFSNGRDTALPHVAHCKNGRCAAFAACKLFEMAEAPLCRVWFIAKMADAQLCRVSAWASSMASRRRERQAWCHLASSIGKSTNSAKTNWQYVSWLLRFTYSYWGQWTDRVSVNTFSKWQHYSSKLITRYPTTVLYKESSVAWIGKDLSPVWIWKDPFYSSSILTTQNKNMSILRVTGNSLTCKFDRRFSGLSSRSSNQDPTEPGLTVKIEFSFA